LAGRVQVGGGGKRFVVHCFSTPTCVLWHDNGCSRRMHLQAPL
jgi:hypothetical protein